jgi:hypothetical protein
MCVRHARGHQTARMTDLADSITQLSYILIYVTMGSAGLQRRRRRRTIAGIARHQSNVDKALY